MLKCNFSENKDCIIFCDEKVVADVLAYFESAKQRQFEDSIGYQV